MNTSTPKTNKPPIEVLVLPPHDLPYVAMVEATPDNGYLPALQRQIAGPTPEQFEPFPVATFDTHEDGTVGFCHAAILDGRGSQLDPQHFPFNDRVLHLPYTLYGTFVVAAGSSSDDLASLTAEQVVSLLDAFASGLEPAEFEQVMCGHSRGAEYKGSGA